MAKHKMVGNKTEAGILAILELCKQARNQAAKERGWAKAPTLHQLLVASGLSDEQIDWALSQPVR